MKAFFAFMLIIGMSYIFSEDGFAHIEKRRDESPVQAADNMIPMPMPGTDTIGLRVICESDPNKICKQESVLGPQEIGKADFEPVTSPGNFIVPTLPQNAKNGVFVFNPGSSTTGVGYMGVPIYSDPLTGDTEIHNIGEADIYYSYSAWLSAMSQLE